MVVRTGSYFLLNLQSSKDWQSHTLWEVECWDISSLIPHHRSWAHKPTTYYVCAWLVHICICVYTLVYTFACIYICMHVYLLCMYVYMSMCAGVCVYLCIYDYASLCVICTHLCIYVCTCEYVYVHLCTCLCTCHLNMCSCGVCICMRVCMYICMQGCVHVCVCAWLWQLSSCLAISKTKGDNVTHKRKAEWRVLERKHETLRLTCIPPPASRFTVNVFLWLRVL